MIPDSGPDRVHGLVWLGLRFPSQILQPWFGGAGSRFHLPILTVMQLRGRKETLGNLCIDLMFDKLLDSLRFFFFQFQ
jgi:hypothetical protein